MTMLARLGGTWRTITAGRIFIGGAWRNLVAVKIYAGGAWRDAGKFVQPLTLAITPSPFAHGGVGPTVTSGNITATPTGGAGPFTYAWTVTSGAVTLNNPTLATCTVTGNVDSGTISITLHCTATDYFGTTATATVSGTLFQRDTVGGLGRQ